MRDEQIELLRVHKDRLLRLTELQSLAKGLQDCTIFTEIEVRNLFASHDERYNKIRFLDALIDKEEAAYNYLVDWLTTIGQSELARTLAAEKSGITPFGKPLYENNDEDPEDDINSSIESEVFSPFNHSQIPLTIKVELATKFLDTYQHNPNIPYYNCRSKMRGKVLIINNHNFTHDRHKPRKGAKVDEDNLTELFTQMGGWIIQTKSNLTAVEIRQVLKQFAQPDRESPSDACFIFIMSHGEDKLNETIIYGTDGHYLTTSAIQTYFTNENCSMFRGKPKVFIYQVCRGNELDLPRRYSTEFDGRRKTSSPPSEPIETRNEPVFEHFRPVEDMLIGHATMQGSKAHRDPFRGTWYIELICEHFMKLAKDESVVDLLVKVDEGLRRRMSEIGTVQTSEHTSKGFKKLYLNPGIFEENGNLVKFEGNIAK